MKLYKVIFESLTTLGVVVEADSIEAAKEEACAEGVRGVCGQCSGGSDGGRRWWRDEGDELWPVVITVAGDSEVWTGPSLLDQRADFELNRMADILEPNDPVAASALRARANELLFRS